VINEVIFEVKESLDGGYEAQALGYSIFTEGEDIEDLKSNIKESILAHFEDDLPSLVRLHIIKDEILEI